MVKTRRRVKELSRVGSVGDTQKSGSPASAADKRLQLPAGNPYSGCIGGGVHETCLLGALGLLGNENPEA